MNRNIIVLLCVILMFSCKKETVSQHIKKSTNNYLESILSWASKLSDDALILKSYSKVFTLSDQNKTEVFDVISQDVYDLRVIKTDSIFNDFTSVSIKRNSRRTRRDTLLLYLNKIYERHELQGKSVYKLKWSYQDTEYTSYCILQGNEVVFDQFLNVLAGSSRIKVEDKSLLFQGKCKNYKTKDPSIFQIGKVLVLDSYGPDRGYIQIFNDVYYNTYITNKGTTEEQLDVKIENVQTRICSDFQGNCSGDAEFESNKISHESLNYTEEYYTINYSAKLEIIIQPEIEDSLKANKYNAREGSGKNGSYIITKEEVRRYAMQFQDL